MSLKKAIEGMKSLFRRSLTFTGRSLGILASFVFQKRYWKLDVFLVVAGLLAIGVSHFYSNPEFRALLGADMNGGVAKAMVVAHMGTRDCKASLHEVASVEIFSERRQGDAYTAIVKVHARFQFVQVPISSGLPNDYIQGVIICNVQMAELHERVGASIGDSLSFHLMIDAWKMKDGSWKVLSVREV
jgi:hypothetical protein